MRFLTSIEKLAIYSRIAAHVAIKYAFKMGPIAYIQFLYRAALLLNNFRHNKIVRVPNGYKLQLYLPSYPGSAFFKTIENKLLSAKPGAATVVYSMTKACNYNCQHCYQKNDAANELSDEKLIETALKIRDTGTTMFDIEGGEPLLKLPRLKRLIESLSGNTEIWINTHGGTVNIDNLLQLKTVGLFGVMISLHSTDSRTHDEFTRSQGSFAAACRAAEITRQAGLCVAINSVLSAEQLSHGQLEKIMELAKKLDCDFVQLIHPKPAGRWLGRSEQLQKNSEQIRYVQKMHKLYNSPKYKNYPSLNAQVFEEDPNALGCTAGGVDRFYVNASGEVQPCEFLNISFGNVNRESFDTIFTRMRSYFETPCQNWLCCTAAGDIAKLFDTHNIKTTPLPWHVTKELVENWNRGKPTKLYKKLGIYKKCC